MTKSNTMREIAWQNEVAVAVLSDSNISTRARVNGGGIGDDVLLRSHGNAIDLLTRLEKENFELRQTVVDLALDLQLLRNGAKKR